MHFFKNMNKSEKIIAYYPLWVKLVSWLGVPLLCFLGLWLLSRPIWKPGLGVMQYAAGFAFGAAVLYQSTVGFKVLRHLTSEIHVDEHGLEIHSSDGDMKYLSWEKIAPVKEYSFAGTVEFKDIDGVTIIYAFSNMKNISAILSLVEDFQTNS
jgi:hypothetical protein